MPLVLWIERGFSTSSATRRVGGVTGGCQVAQYIARLMEMIIDCG